LNATAVDDYFRTFNGHTQVNATDLKRLKYPSRETLITLGEWEMTQPELTQKMIVKKLELIIFWRIGGLVKSRHPLKNGVQDFYK
jgi:adenine-specific DNA-methyltransferase